MGAVRLRTPSPRSTDGEPKTCRVVECESRASARAYFLASAAAGKTIIKKRGWSDAETTLLSCVSALFADDFASRAAALEERAAADPPTTWRPNGPDEHPAMIVGVMESREPGPDFGYGPHDVVVLRTPTGTRWSVFLMHQVLREEFDRKQPRPGDLVAVKYEGRIQGGQGASGFEKYRLEVDRDAVRVTDSPAAPLGAPTCIDCGHVEPDHAANCPSDLPPF
jgi:hypothetical protein